MNSTGQDDIGTIRRIKRAIFLRRKSLGQTLRYSRGQPEAKRIVYVAGCQRSGTNLVLNMLEQSDLTDVYHETDSRSFDTYALRPESVIDALIAKSRPPFFVIKCLLESDRLTEFLDRFEDARGLFVYRHFNDVVRSIVASWPNGRNRIDQIVANPADGKWRTDGISEGTLARVRALYRPDLNNFSANALFWFIRNSLFFEKQFDRDPRVMLLRFDNLVDENAATVRRIAGFLDLPATPRMIALPNRGRVRKRQELDIDPAIREACTALLDRLDAEWQAKTDLTLT
ncbi:MAG: sulfotransferase family protein [Alphaproteobacteria bacterium]